MNALDESTGENAALEWLSSLGYTVLSGHHLAFGMPDAERIDPDYRDVMLGGRLHQALTRFNPDLPAETQEEAFRKLTRAETPSLLEQNRTLHRMPVEGVTVRVRRRA